jgi:hypothetical protein
MGTEVQIPNPPGAATDAPQTTTQKIEDAATLGAQVVSIFNPGAGTAASAGIQIGEALLPTFAILFQTIANLFHHAHKQQLAQAQLKK